MNATNGIISHTFLFYMWKPGNYEFYLCSKVGSVFNIGIKTTNFRNLLSTSTSRSADPLLEIIAKVNNCCMFVVLTYPQVHPKALGHSVGMVYTDDNWQSAKRLDDGEWVMNKRRDEFWSCIFSLFYVKASEVITLSHV